MGAAVLFTRSVLAFSPPLELVATVIVGAIVYLGAGLALRLPIFAEAMNMLKRPGPVRDTPT
jgi:hypothetical protein